jgi:hypothetical protein
MKRLIFITGIIACLLVNSAFAQESKRKSRQIEKKTETVKSEKKSKHDFTGTIISITALATGGDGKISVEEAKKLSEKGWPLGLKIGKKIFIIVNSDGSYAGPNLVKAGSVNVAINGKKLTRAGINFISADLIKAVD